MTQYFSSSFGKIAFTDTQSGAPVLIFMHGLPTSKELWEPVAAHLNPEFRVVAFDLNDYGESEKPNRPIDHQARAGVLDELRAHLGLDRFHLVAHDLGSSVAIDYMGLFARHVEKLVLMSPPVYPDFREPAIVRLTRLPVAGEGLVLFARKLLFKIGIKNGMVHKERLTAPLLEAFSRNFTGPKGRAALLRIIRWGHPAEMFAGYPRIIQGISVPTLIIQGQRDPYIPPSQVTRLHADIPGSWLVFIEEGGHFLPIDTPTRVGELVNEFIGEHLP